MQRNEIKSKSYQNKTNNKKNKKIKKNMQSYLFTTVLNYPWRRFSCYVCTLPLSVMGSTGYFWLFKFIYVSVFMNFMDAM